jgi:hypothetical protein
MARRTAPTWILWSLVALLGLNGCGDDKPPTREIFVENGADAGLNILPTGDLGPGVETDAGGGGAGGGQNNPFTYILIAVGDDEPTVPIGGTVNLGVMLFDQNGDGVEGERITFQILDDDGTATLSAARTQTGDDGYAQVSFQGGGAPGIYAIEASHPDTRTVRFDVQVAQLPTGSLDIGMEYVGPVALGRFDVFIVDDPFFCEDPYYLTAPQDVVYSESVEGLGSRVMLENQFAGRRVSVLVRGRTASNAILAAGGCEGDIAIPNGTTKRVTVSLFPLPLNPAGTYDLLNNFDLTGAIPGTLGDVVRGLLQFFGSQNQPREIAGLIFDLVEGLVRNYAGAIGGFIIDVVRGWVEDDLNEIINDYIDEDAPDWVRDFFLIGQDLIGVVSYLEVISRVRLSKPRLDGTFDGSQNWIGLAFYWRLSCQGNPDPACGRYAFTMDEVASAAQGIELVFGQFTGRIHSYDKGIFDSHTMDLQYGRLILFVLNNIILPAIADGATSLREGLLNLANCPAFANGITGGDSHLRLAGINIASRDTIEGWCTTIMGVAGDAGEAILGGLRIDTRMTLEANFSFVEETDDLVVDRIESGIWEGILRTSNDAGPPFNGTFYGDMQQ